MAPARTLCPTHPDTDVVADAVLTASRLLIAVSAGSIAAVDETITIPQFRLLVVLRTRGAMKQSVLAEHLSVNPSTINRMVERLIAAGLVDRQVHPESPRGGGVRPYPPRAPPG